MQKVSISMSKTSQKPSVRTFETEDLSRITTRKLKAVFAYREEGFLLIMRKELPAFEKKDLERFAREELIDKIMKTGDTKVLFSE